MFEENLTVCPSCLSPLKGNERFCRDCGQDLKNVSKSSAYDVKQQPFNQSKYKDNSNKYYNENKYNSQSSAHNNTYSGTHAGTHYNAHTGEFTTAQNNYSQKSQPSINYNTSNMNNTNHMNYNANATSQYQQQSIVKNSKNTRNAIFVIILIVMLMYSFLTIAPNILYSISSGISSESIEDNYIDNYDMSHVVEEYISPTELVDHYYETEKIIIQEPKWFNENADFIKVEDIESEEDTEYYYQEVNNEFYCVMQSGGLSLFMKAPINDDPYISSTFDDYYMESGDLSSNSNTYVSYDLNESYNFTLYAYVVDYVSDKTVLDYISAITAEDYRDGSMFTLQETVVFESGIAGYAYVEQTSFDINYTIAIPQSYDGDGSVNLLIVTVSATEYSGEYTYDILRAVDELKENIYITQNSQLNIV